MTDKIYEMDDNHKQAVADLLTFIEMRDEMIEAIKIAPPGKIREGQELLAGMDKKIEECEAALAKEYESYQTHQRALEEQAELNEQILETMAGVFIHFKYRHPDKLDAMNAEVFNNWDADEREDFDDRVAILEATDLIKIIAVEGETPEQTEAYLKNFRAASESSSDE